VDKIPPTFKTHYWLYLVVVTDKSAYLATLTISLLLAVTIAQAPVRTLTLPAPLVEPQSCNATVGWVTVNVELVPTTVAVEGLPNAVIAEAESPIVTPVTIASPEPFASVAPVATVTAEPALATVQLVIEIVLVTSPPVPVEDSAPVAAVIAVPRVVFVAVKLLPKTVLVAILHAPKTVFVALRAVPNVVLVAVTSKPLDPEIYKVSSFPELVHIWNPQVDLFAVTGAELAVTFGIVTSSFPVILGTDTWVLPVTFGILTDVFPVTFGIVVVTSLLADLVTLDTLAVPLVGVILVVTNFLLVSAVTDLTKVSLVVLE